MAALVWLVVGVALVAAEVLSGAFVLLMLGVAGMVAALVAYLGAGTAISAGAFALTAIGGITFARPALQRRFHAGGHVKTNVDALIGVKAIVTSQVDADHGRVKIGGEIWSARAYDETQVIEPGHAVTVMSISGATALVWEGP